METPSLTLLRKVWSAIKDNAEFTDREKSVVRTELQIMEEEHERAAGAGADTPYALSCLETARRREAILNRIFASDPQSAYMAIFVEEQTRLQNP